MRGQRLYHIGAFIYEWGYFQRGAYYPENTVLYSCNKNTLSTCTTGMLWQLLYTENEDTRYHNITGTNCCLVLLLPNFLEPHARLHGADIYNCHSNK